MLGNSLVCRDRKNILQTDYLATAMAAKRLRTNRVRWAGVSSGRYTLRTINKVVGTVAQFSQFGRVSRNQFGMGWQTNVWRAMTAKDTGENEG